jgi:hypothetical protein
VKRREERVEEKTQRTGPADEGSKREEEEGEGGGF